jgi:hypothetical protein
MRSARFFEACLGKLCAFKRWLADESAAALGYSVAASKLDAMSPSANGWATPNVRILRCGGASWRGCSVGSDVIYG